MNKKRNYLAIALNILIIIFATYSVLAFFFNLGFNQELIELEVFKYFTIDSNVLLLLSSALIIPFEIRKIRKNEAIPKSVQVIKYIATSATTLTFLTVICFLAPVGVSNGISFLYYFSNSNLFLHLLCPILGIISYCFLECEIDTKRRVIFLAIIPMVVYGVIYALMVLVFKKWSDFYGFNQNDKYWISIILMLIAMLLIALIIYYINKKMHLKFLQNVEKSNGLMNNNIKDVSNKEENIIMKETKKAPAKKTEKKEVKKAAPAKKVEKKAEKKGPANAYKDKARVYHISRNDEDLWQVKLAGGEKAIKLFKTQKEAIDYANDLVETQGGSIRIHSLKGKIRK